MDSNKVTANMNYVRPEDMAYIETKELAEAFIEQQVEEIRAQVGDNKVILALSGGVDSSVVAALLLKAIGDKLVCVHVNHGLMRKHESDDVVELFKNKLGVNLIYRNEEERYLKLLEGVTSPEEKRNIIGNEFIKIFDEEAVKQGDVPYLAQGTIYPDILESKDGIKAHHNVGGLPEGEEMILELVEPLKLLYKDEVRIVGEVLGLPHEMVYRQPFPGPGLGVRCLGAITSDRLEVLREADAILREEFDNIALSCRLQDGSVADKSTQNATSNAKSNARPNKGNAKKRDNDRQFKSSGTLNNNPFASLKR